MNHLSNINQIKKEERDKRINTIKLKAYIRGLDEWIKHHKRKIKDCKDDKCIKIEEREIAKYQGQIATANLRLNDLNK